MKRLLFVLCFVFIMISLKCQDFTEDKAIIDKEIAEYIEKGLYINASDLLLNFAQVLELAGDTLSAYSYYLRNCNFIEGHYSDLMKQGLSVDEYFSYWIVAIDVGNDLGLKDDCLSLLFRLLKEIDEIDQQFFLSYESRILFFLAHCRIPEYYELTGYYLQQMLDVLKKKQPTKESVKSYIEINRFFLINRMYNSFKDNKIYNDRLQEIIQWYDHNRWYIDNLNVDYFESEIVDFYLLFTDELSMYASTYSAQNQDIEHSIEAYNLELSILKATPCKNTIINQKRALCYTNIAMQYNLLLDDAACKEYADKAFDEISEHLDNLDYCYMLNNLSFVYFNSHQYEKASRLKLNEITLKNKLGVDVTLTDWTVYYTFVNAFDPQKVISHDRSSLPLKEASMTSLIGYYEELGNAYTFLSSYRNDYQDLALQCYEMMDSIIEAHHGSLANQEWLGPISIDEYSVYKSSLYSSLGRYYLKQKDLEMAYDYYQKSISLYDRNRPADYYNISLISSFVHDLNGIPKYVPYYYKLVECEINRMLPLYGSIESDCYLMEGDHPLYYFPEWASWNPTDSVSTSIAYDAALLMKGLTLRYNVLTPYFESHPDLIIAKRELDRMRDSIYAIPDDNSRDLALHRYELKEREILKEVNDELANIHWNDVANQLNENEACVEFVKYTADAYSWSDNIPRPHYAALVLQHKATAPVFVDLFDEDELMDMYNLQPKSYDNEIGLTLYSKIWGKLQQYIDGNNRVFFSPMGLLNLINVELLTDSTGMTAAERFNLYRVSSTRNILTRDENRDIHSVAMFGGVDYENAQEYDEMLVSMNTRGNWAYLQNTLLEVEQIEDLLKGSGVNVATHTGSFATEGAFKQLDGTQANIVHIASHGYYIPQTQRTSVPYFSNSESTANIQDELFYSGLILSGGQKAWADSAFKPDNKDGILTAYEISKLDLHNVNLVVLSACETGLGDDLFDGIFGLQRAFKKAGVSSILMSLWQIDDRATSEYMSLFYEKLVEGYSKHDAYISTVLTMKERYPDANYWASFVLLD